ncbi:MFS transporter [Cellulomonas sp. NS3]|uniref:MFS transporter n=1 Tax=Cellulomonas sp. NS3 TaxID=2973977 RepID=UPI0021633AE0|nr:MFS transporter [Cellulomonas sp. NS3]
MTARADEPAVTAPGRRRAAAIALLVAGQSTAGLALGAVGLFLPLIRADLGIGFTQAGGIAAAAMITYALMQVPAGHLADVLGARRLFVVGTVGVNLCTLGIAVAPSYAFLVVDQAVSGALRALVFIPGMVLITGLFAAERRSTALGVFAIGGVSGNVLLGAVGPLLVGPLGWRGVLALFGAAGLVLAVVYGVLRDAGAPQARPAPGGAGARDVLRHPVLWVAGVVQLVRFGVVNTLTFWLPTLLVEERGATLRTAGVVMGVGGLLMAPMNYLGGVLADRTGRPATVVGGSLVVLGAALAVLAGADGLTVTVACVLVAHVVMQLYFGPLFSIPVRVLGPARAGLLTGVSNGCACLGAVTFSWALGWTKDLTGSFTPGLVGLSVACAVALTATWPLGRMLRAAPSR